MKWNPGEVERLSPILKQIYRDLEPLQGKRISVLCCGSGEVALWLGHRVGPGGKVVGLDLNEDLVRSARLKARHEGLEDVVEFRKVEQYRIPLPDEVFDALVSEFIIFPAQDVAQIGEPEMARVLKPGGKMVLTDVIMDKALPEEVLSRYEEIGLDYICQGSRQDFYAWMGEAGLVDVELVDFTPLVREVWEQRLSEAHEPEDREAYSTLLDDPEYGIGHAIFYIYAQGTKKG